jgi:hypothetical protein
MKLTSRRAAALLAGALVIGAPTAAVWLAAAPAEAAHNASRLVPNVTALQASAGTCAVFTVTPVDTFGQQSQSSDTMTVTLAENPNSPDQDVDFCVPFPANPKDNFQADTPSEDPSYVAQDNSGTPVPPPSNSGPRTHYKASDSISDPDNAGRNPGGEPDNSDDGTGFSIDPSHTNPAGKDAARYSYVYTTGRGPIRIGVVGLTAGSANINVCFDDGGTFTPQNKNNYACDSEEVQTGVIPFTITDGGYPGSVVVADAPKQIVPEPTDGAGTPNATQPFTVTLKNGAGDTVRGVTPLIRVSSTGPNPNAPATCDQSDNAGVSRCTFIGTNPGTDLLTIYVNRSGGTAGPDGNEVQQTVTRTTTKPAVAAAEARYIDLAPRAGSMTAGTNKTFTAAVTDVNGAPAQGVQVTFSETGPGSFATGGSTAVATTDATGRATVLVTTATTDAGTETITAAITTAATQCSQQAGFGNGASASTPAGRCSDSTTNTITAKGASPSPSTSRSPSPSTSGGRAVLSLRTSTPDIQPNETGILDASGQPNASVELRCYSRPSTTYVTARGPLNLTSGGATQFQIKPGANTRCYVRYAGEEASASNSVVVNVHTTLSLSAVRNSGVRNYTFQGRNLPRRSGQLITLYRIDNNGNEIRTSNLTTDSSGIYRVARHFTGTGTFTFVVRTSQTLNNAAGVSNPYRITIR